jgi:hypothetical protein
MPVWKVSEPAASGWSTGGHSMQEQEIEMELGESIEIGEFTITLVDLEDGEVSLRIDPKDDFDEVCITDGVVRKRS